MNATELKGMLLKMQRAVCMTHAARVRAFGQLDQEEWESGGLGAATADEEAYNNSMGTLSRMEELLLRGDAYTVHGLLPDVQRLVIMYLTGPDDKELSHAWHPPGLPEFKLGGGGRGRGRGRGVNR